MIWTQSVALSTLPFNYLVSEAESGISLSNLREAGAPIKGYEGAASGVVPVMKLFEDSFSYSNQLGQRQGAGVVYLNVFHPDIIAFLSTKKENADEKFGLKPSHSVLSFG